MSRVWRALATPGQPWKLWEHFVITASVTAGALFLYLLGYSL